MARHSREQLDSLGATGTHIVVSGDLDEFAIAALAAAPVDAYGVGTSVVTGSGAADGEHGLQARRGRRPSGRQAIGEQAEPRRPQDRAPRVQAERDGGGRDRRERRRPTPGEGERALQIPLIAAGEQVADLPTLDESRERLRAGTVTLPWDGLKLSRGEPAIPTRLRLITRPARTVVGCAP